MAASQRVSRGFHRLALVVAAISLLVGGVSSAYVAVMEADYALGIILFAFALAASLAVYGIVRAIGWVIGGFAAT